jgi:putative mRNA 3-end processing factor
MREEPDDLIVRRPQGLYCPAGDFYVDPWRAVDRAVITHAHADHARRGHGAYLAAAPGAAVLRARLGDVALQGVPYGEVVTIDGVRVSLHPAGHVLGSAQVRVEHRGRVWVVSGDYFTGADDADRNPTCAPFEPVRCDCFVTESTFGLPVYRWRSQREVLAQVNAWWHANANEGRTSVLMGYSFGKAQRLLAGVDASIGPIVVHPAVDAMNAAYRAGGVVLPATRRLDEPLDPATLARALVVTPPGTQRGAWRAQAASVAAAFASGWMQLRKARARLAPDRGFVLSDHADWPGLLRAIDATGAQRVIVTHGFEQALVGWLRARGLQAGSFVTGYGRAGAPGAAEDAETAEPAPA